MSRCAEHRELMLDENKAASLVEEFISVTEKLWQYDYCESSGCWHVRKAPVAEPINSDMQFWTARLTELEQRKITLEQKLLEIEQAIARFTKHEKDLEDAIVSYNVEIEELKERIANA